MTCIFFSAFMKYKKRPKSLKSCHSRIPILKITIVADFVTKIDYSHRPDMRTVIPC